MVVRMRSQLSVGSRAIRVHVRTGRERSTSAYSIAIVDASHERWFPLPAGGARAYGLHAGGSLLVGFAGDLFEIADCLGQGSGDQFGAGSREPLTGFLGGPRGVP